MFSEILIRDYRAEKKIAVGEWIASGSPERDVGNGLSAP
jgi:hypothetical protein